MCTESERAWSWNGFNWDIHCPAAGTEWDGMVGVNMLVVTLCGAFCAEARNSNTAVYKHSDS